MHEIEGRNLFRQMIAEAKLDADAIMKALDDSISLGFVEWGESREIISRLLSNPTPEDIHNLIINSEFLIRPLQDWVIMERNLNEQRKGSVSKYEYYDAEYKCSQIQNFILILKLY
jgi:hypothetical protein